MLNIVNLCITNKEKNKFLFLNRIKPPFKGYWGMLGGKVNENEEPNVAASRESFEESGIVSIGEYLGKCHEKIIENNVLYKEFEIYFFHFIVEETVEFNSGIEGELKWISAEDFKNNTLIPSDPLMIDAFFNKGLKAVESIIEKKEGDYSQKKFEERKNFVEEIKKFVRKICDTLVHGDEYYDNHFSSVVKYSKLLGEKRNADLEILEISAWLHDIGSILHGRENHHIVGAEIAEKKLRELGYPEEKIIQVKHCILAHRGSKDIKRESVETETLADADSMSHFDEIGGLFKYEFITSGINFKQKEAQRRVKEKLERSYNKLSESAKSIIKPKYEAAMLILNNEKSEYKKNKLGVGVGVMLIRDGKILLGKRHFDNNVSKSVLGGEGSWTMPGGKLESNETFEEGAIREVKEETGLSLHNLKVFCINNDKNENAHYITIGLFSDNFSGELQVMEPDKITEWVWFDLVNLPAPLYFPSAKMIKNYTTNKFYIAEQN